MRTLDVQDGRGVEPPGIVIERHQRGYGRLGNLQVAFEKRRYVRLNGLFALVRKRYVVGRIARLTGKAGHEDRVSTSFRGDSDQTVMHFQDQPVECRFMRSLGVRTVDVEVPQQ